MKTKVIVVLCVGAVVCVTIISLEQYSIFLNWVTISGHIRTSIKKKDDIFPLVLLWFWSFLIIFGSYFLRGLTSKSRREASNEPIFDRLDIFSDAMNLKNTLVLLFRSSEQPQVAYKKSRPFFK